ncbi:MAG TPA: hypothetical protein P5287_02755 [bacterium]|nr:hypothetical protein [bacterium]
MARQKNSGGKHANGGFVKNLTLFAVIGVTVALAYLWQHTQIIRTGYIIRDKEKRLAVLKKENQCLRLRICQLKSPRHIEQMIAQKDLRLASTKNWQYVYLQTAGAPSAAAPSLVAAKGASQPGKQVKKVSLHQPKDAPAARGEG